MATFKWTQSAKVSDDLRAPQNRQLGRAFGAVWLVAVLSAAGCGGDSNRVAVVGSVDVDGRLLPDGAIVFVPRMGTPGSKVASKVTEGRFEIPRQDGPQVGQYTVRIYANPAPSYALDDPVDFAQHAPRSGPANPIPPEFNDRSRLVENTTAEGPNEFHFHLHSKMKPSR